MQLSGGELGVHVTASSAAVDYQMRKFFGFGIVYCLPKAGSPIENNM